MRALVTIENIESDGRVYARSSDGNTSLTCKPDPVSDGWKVGDTLDILAGPSSRKEGGSMFPGGLPKPPIPGVPKPRDE